MKKNFEIKGLYFDDWNEDIKNPFYGQTVGDRLLIQNHVSLNLGLSPTFQELAILGDRKFL